MDAQKVLGVLNPNLKQTLTDKYDAALPGMSEAVVDWAYDKHYGREGADLKTRQLCAVAALTAMGGHTSAQLRMNIEHTLNAGARPTEIMEIIWQMAVYAGVPAALNGLNTAIAYFEEKGLDPRS
ncbi:carboxymuconolactone decarboxylase family protein [Pseudovibrio sp. Tun.PSC04-5.I4]|uniref:carboxymuconolactone decarboxylase family protein n=1 Tax=Pseudovibrio sp. Tun.PSC04-5.I4 TaxID=1798213 RepID=UPI00088035AD|nr:carboxymuconolactone decarboxylase family protein [Pseudovibrio sp. Tun.PSC04-5.I4]SDR04914.1 4-carboxymuconolactone decarboxylase [Pseudovibrio sp. Tun.PSC04-5.I4]